MRPLILQAIALAVLAAFAGPARLQAAQDPPTNIEVDVSFVSFELKDVEAMARETRGAAPTQKQIQQAWTQGKGKLVATSKLVTISGQQTKTEGVLENIYPTEYAPPRVASASTGMYNESSPREANRPTPGGFQTWNAGCTISLTAQIDEVHHRINLILKPELSKFLGWDSIEVGQNEHNKKTKVWYLQPSLQTQRIDTSLIVPLGQTRLTGGLPDSTAKKLIYIFITARKAGPPR